MNEIAIVLVAGGLGERLGYADTKLNIPFESIHHTTFLQHICNHIVAMQTYADVKKIIPLVIMTSNQTHGAIESTLHEQNFFGLSPKQIYLIQQRLVPAFSDKQAHLALQSKYHVWLKPHGHGDVHQLLYEHQMVQNLSNQGVKYFCFIQDTNAQVFNALLPTLGAAVQHQYHYTAIAVERSPDEAVGALVHVKNSKSNKEQILNIEYNELNQWLKSALDDSKKSIFRLGNINALIVEAVSYQAILYQTKGLMPEFVNPKYQNETYTTFAKPTRLECMMQDLSCFYHDPSKVGIMLFHRAWCFSPLKNTLEGGQQRYSQNIPPESATSSESDFYWSQEKKCEIAGMQIHHQADSMQEIKGLPFTKGPKILLHPKMGLTLSTIKEKIIGGHLYPDSTLVVMGKNVFLHNVAIETQAGLEIHAMDEAHVVIKNLTVSHEGYLLKLLTEKQMQDAANPSHWKLRGYYFEKKNPLVYVFTTPGYYEIDPQGIVHQISPNRSSLSCD